MPSYVVKSRSCLGPTPESIPEQAKNTIADQGSIASTISGGNSPNQGADRNIPEAPRQVAGRSPASVANSNTCPLNLQHLAAKLPTYSDPELDNIRRQILSLDMRTVMQQARAQGLTPRQAADQSLQQSEEFEKGLPAAEQCIRGSNVERESTIRALKNGTYNLSTSAGSMGCERAYVSYYYGVVANQETAVILSCMARANPNAASTTPPQSTAARECDNIWSNLGSKPSAAEINRFQSLIDRCFADPRQKKEMREALDHHLSALNAVYAPPNNVKPQTGCYYYDAEMNLTYNYGAPGCVQQQSQPLPRGGEVMKFGGGNPNDVPTRPSSRGVIGGPQESTK